MRSQSTPVVIPQYPAVINVSTNGEYRRHGFLRGLLVLLLSGPVGLILYMRGSGAITSVVVGILVTALILAAYAAL